MSKEFEIIETQEQFDKAISKRIGELQSKHSETTAELQKTIEALTAENAELNKGLEENKAKYAEYDKTLADLEGKVKTYELESLKSKIAREIGLDYKAISYLQGSNEEEIKASAEGLKELLPGKATAPRASSEPAVTESNQKLNIEQSMNKWLKEMK